MRFLPMFLGIIPNLQTAGRFLKGAKIFRKSKNDFDSTLRDDQVRTIDLPHLVK
mgnify:CR=1 FL=1